MNTKIDNHLIDSDLSPTAFLVYCRLKRHFPEGTTSQPVTRLAEVCGVSRPTFYQAARELQALGWLSVGFRLITPDNPDKSTENAAA